MVSVRFTQIDHDRLERKAKIAGLTLGQWVGKSALEADPHLNKKPAEQVVARLNVRKPQTAKTSDLTAYCDELLAKVGAGKNPDVIELILAHNKLSRSLRRIVREFGIGSAIEALYDDCIKTCDLLAHGDMREAVKSIAQYHSSIPIAHHVHNDFNKRNTELIGDVKLGSKQSGLRKKAKWRFDAFAEVVKSIVDHLESIHELMGSPSFNKALIQIKNAPSKVKNGAQKSDPPPSKAVVKIIKDPDFSDIRELCTLIFGRGKSSHDKRAERDLIWKLVSKVFIRSKAVPDEEYIPLHYEKGWEDILAKSSLQNAVKASCDKNGRNKKTEIKRRLRERFFAFLG